MKYPTSQKYIAIFHIELYLILGKVKQWCSEQDTVLLFTNLKVNAWSIQSNVDGEGRAVMMWSQ